MKRFVMCGVFTLLLVFAASAMAADMVDNPAYQAWAKYKVGSFVKYKMTTVASGVNTEMEHTMTLVELTPEKAVIETKMSMGGGGPKTAIPASKMDIPAKIAKDKVAPEGSGGQVMPGSKVNVLGKGEEDIDVNGKKVKAKWVKMEVEAKDTKSVMTSWTNSDIPSTLVKSSTKMEKPMVSDVTMTLVDYKADKK